MIAEELRKLQAKWRRHAKVDCSPANGSATAQAAGRRSADCADELDPILALAEAQEKELEKATGQLDIIQRECEGEDDAFLANDYGGLGWEQEKPVTTVRTIRQELAAMKEQHSADLREIAEMAIAKESEYWRAFQGYWDYGLPKPTEITADSIVREFREKKSKGGDAQ